MVYLYVAHIQLIICLQATWRLTSYYPWSLDLLGLIDVPFQLPGEHTSLQTFCASDLLLSNILPISILPGKLTHSHLSEMKHVWAQH